MEITKALEIIKALSQGVDPHTGEIYPPDSPYQHPDTVRALFEALKVLEHIQERNKRQKSLPENAGKPWSGEEDKLLIDQFDNGVSLKELSINHGRTEGAIKPRLVQLGRINLVDTA